MIREHEIRPHKALGQNFLIDRNVLQLMMNAAALRDDDTVIEIGPGLGAVTTGLLQSRARRILSIEKDPKLFAYLQKAFAHEPRLTVQHADALTLDLAGVAGTGDTGRYCLISNLPYSVGTRILVNAIQQDPGPATIVVTVQKEVADRMAAAPGGKTYGLLSVWAQQAYEVTAVHRVSPRCFYPVPDVVSTIVKLTSRDRRDAARAGAFYAMTKHAFNSRRKQLVAVLGSTPGVVIPPGDVIRAFLTREGLPSSARPETLSPDHWWGLAGLCVGR
ncbi:MAG: 16S rRNA (adenine(1518)-N(6)/adenine(1519)-N(6))-dimethyltransferase RsmA [Verrucomicrobia bacterium]|nr:16S rRNA (adenine(1518)-N(6)/adenine(1519)-N(6))-dimethyltransferase RsmA [Verrucomicrobiota bacterium]